MRRISTPRFDIVTATAQHLLVERDDAQKLGKLLGVDVPAEWPPYPESVLQATLDQVHRGPDQIGWWSRYVVLRGSAGVRSTLVGTVGLRGRPDPGGAVGLSVHFLPAYEGLELVREPIGALVDWAFDQSEAPVELVRAVSRAPHEAGPFEALGFAEVDGGEGDARRWQLTRTSWQQQGRRVPRLVPQPKEAPIAGLPKVAREVFDALVAEPLRDVETLRAQLREYVRRIEAAAADSPAVDAALARDIARVCDGLLAGIHDAIPEHTRRQVQAAVRYFVTEQDGDSDLAIGGLDEDAAVANAVARHLGREDLVSSLI
jgi:RimJ/RimL family protein N-acetyltransferase